MKKLCNNQQNKGITLIALVITIIVLLILAGVSISTLTGENGILTQATTAKEKNEIAGIVEEIKLDIIEKQTSNNNYGKIYETELKSILDKYGEIQYETDGTTIKGIIADKGSYEIGIEKIWTGEFAGQIKDKNGIYLVSTTINGVGKGANNPTIPVGFKTVDTDGASWGDGTTAPSPDAVSAGLVIEDKEGNQFVWVPVDGTTIKYEKHAYVTTSTEDTSSTADTGNGNWKTYRYRKYSDWKDDTAEGNKTSVEKYGGFYVARYEAGVPSDADFFANTDGATYYTSGTTPSKNVDTYKPVSKANNQSWNYISKENALKVASKMYEGSSAVKSQLIDGYAWDAISTWIGNDTTNYANIHADSRNYGNYYTSTFTLSNVFNATHNWNNGWTPATTYTIGSVTEPGGSGTGRKELATGVLSNAKLKNIYDFAGNMWELTTETGLHGASEGSTKYSVLRGGGSAAEVLTIQCLTVMAPVQLVVPASSLGSVLRFT